MYTYERMRETDAKRRRMSVPRNRWKITRTMCALALTMGNTSKSKKAKQENTKKWMQMGKIAFVMSMGMMQLRTKKRSRS